MLRHFQESLRGVAECVLDGEMMTWDPGSKVSERVMVMAEKGKYVILCFYRHRADS